MESNKVEHLTIRNPRTGECDFSLEITSSPQVKALAQKLKKAQGDWWEAGLEHRILVMQKFADALEKHKEPLVNALVEDTGRYIESELEVDVTASTIRRWCNQAPALLHLAEPRSAEIPFIEIQQDYLPYPLVGVISPWNFPLLLSLVDAIPALIAGSSVLLKPSEVTSRFVKSFLEALVSVPELNKVFAVVTGDGKVGSDVIANIDTLCFTGSVKTGRIVAEACAKKFIPAFLELGGKDPAIVCADADIDLAATALCWASMGNAGQTCMSLERAYVHKDVYEEFTHKLTAQVKSLRHNYPNIQEGKIGPIIAQSQVEVVRSQLADAKAKGAHFLCGGEVVNLGGGDYCQPTVITNVTADMLVVTQETFAAILTVVKVDSDEQAVTMANDTIYGLSAAVFSQNIEHAKKIASKIEAGAISINDAALTGLIHEAEKQSFKHSGLGGSRMGAESIRRFIRKKAYIRNTGTPSPWWF
jgi:acyl-CoA reductase-like NAD-dependent aldehyde dehydrogenase